MPLIDFGRLNLPIEDDETFFVKYLEKTESYQYG